MFLSLEKFFMADVIKVPNGCWVWCGAKWSNGYGRTSKTILEAQRAHVVAYKLFVGDIPEGLMLDHLCRNKLCVTPQHLEPVTNQENQKRGYWGQRTHCNYGHEYTPENTHLQYMTGRKYPKRRCRACGAEAQRRYRA